MPLRGGIAMKKVLGALAVLALVAAVVVWYFIAYRLDGLIKENIESAGSAALGTAVRVGAVHTDIRNGSLTISDITVFNPPGYSNPHAFSLAGIEAAVDYRSLDIRRVIIEKPEIVIEEKGGETNFTELLAGIERRGGQAAGGDRDEGAPVIVIHHFRMNGSRAAFESESLDRRSEIRIDAVELNGIQGTPAQVASVIATRVVREVVSAAAMELLKAKASEKISDILGRNKD